MQADPSPTDDEASSTTTELRSGATPGHLPADHSSAGNSPAGHSQAGHSSAENSPTGHSPVGRRRILVAAAGAIAAATAGCIGGSGPSATSDDWEYVDDGPDYDGWFDDTSNFEGTVDWTGEDAVTVDVGAGDQGRLFAPPAIRIDVGTTVTWEWSGAGGPHNVVAESGAFSSGSSTADGGATFEHSFEETGIYRYVCEPHVGMGMVGAIEVV